MKYSAVVIGVSAGGMNALGKILPALPENFVLPLIIVQHVSPQSDNYMIRHFDSISKIKVKEADEKEEIIPGVAYFAPPNYHLLIEENRTFSLSTEGRVNYSRPSVDVLFESAIYAYCSGLVGIILTGANNDGSKGLKMIKDCGGLAIVQEPSSAEVSAMPEAAIKLSKVDYILKLEEIGPLLVKLSKEK
ncbi:MAG: chemotaxis protein CheB [Bacteroidales bacterium]|nr:chemotaxis protein CheB [Bacteroidales bacterium]